MNTNTEAKRLPDDKSRVITLLNNRVKSSDLLERCKKVFIIHKNEEYMLRLTNKGKLILTK
ncbi:MAG: hypothetical protein CMI30_05090 [Opitutae bacterium]|nr:hypothetical protein [Opitutae bacterium]